jgi:hypothetical protein
MDPVRGPDRRSVLKWAALGATALAGGVAAGAIVEGGVPALGERVAGTEAGQRLQLSGRSFRVLGLARGQLPVPGTQLALVGELLGRGGRKLGEFYSTSIYVGAPHGAGEAAASYVETHHFNLPGGSLIGSGTWHVSGTSRFAIVGGTGRYAGATGTYEAVQRPVEMGGDGTASFTIDLATPGGVNGSR